MDPKVGAYQEGGDSKSKKKPESGKLSKIPVNQVYKMKILRIFPSYAIKDFSQTITFNNPTAFDVSNPKSIDLVDRLFLQKFPKKKHKYLHLGLVQVTIKPLTRGGLDEPIVVCLRDHRHRDPENSLLAMVQTNLSEGPLYFNCFPSFSVLLTDALLDRVLVLDVLRNGSPLAITYRIVCKAMVDLHSEAFEEPTLGKTTYFQGNPQSLHTTVWGDVQTNWPVWDDVLTKSRGFPNTTNVQVCSRMSATKFQNV